MRGNAAKLILIAGMASSLWAQSATPTFVVASIKRNTTGSNSSSSHGTKGQLTMENISLQRLIERAYNLKPFQLVGPDWMNAAHFDITAKMPAVYDQTGLPLMLQAMLAERFHLTIHRESKEMSAYALLVAKGGAKMKEAEPGEGSSTNSNTGHLKCERVSMERLADQLARSVDLPVVDQTGLTKDYSFTLDWTQEERASAPSAEPGEPKSDKGLGVSLYAALQEQLGLRLAPKKLPIPMVVVDRLERVPTEN